jgi:hypothetical protein
VSTIINFGSSVRLLLTVGTFSRQLQVYFSVN